MRLLLLGFGTTGDVLPLAHLADALGAAGHEVTLASSPMFERFASGRRFRFAPEGPALDPARVAGAFAAAARAGALGELRTIIERVFLADAEAYAGRAERLAREHDAAIVHGLDFAGACAVRRAARPWASVVYCPAVVPTRARSAGRGPSLGAWVNALSWSALNAGLDLAHRGLRDRLARLGPIDGLRWLSAPSPALNLVAASEVVTGPLDDLPSTYHATGEWRGASPLPELSPEVRAFLAAGPVDVLLGFGSMIGFEGGEPVGEAFVEACRRLGLRGILQRGWADERAPTEGADVLVAAELPHDAVFPRVGVVVHHGGAGTSHAVVRAGAASVVVAHVQEQGYWARTLHERGLAAPPMRRSAWSRARLVRALEWVRSRPEIARRAAGAAASMRDEDGVGRAVRVIERWGRAQLQPLRRPAPRS
ncbi:MAG: glycosyltransferase family 1 protein [Polyangiaceae bacterium]|nr:glycosyltransferase family 1 protein [Polyangiaceae bacterium]